MVPKIGEGFHGGSSADFGTILLPGLVAVIPATPMSITVSSWALLGCVYYPWQFLAPLPVLRYAVPVNPVVYISEGLHAALTSDVPHMNPAAFLGAMVLMLGFLVAAGLKTFLRRVTA